MRQLKNKLIPKRRNVYVNDSRRVVLSFLVMIKSEERNQILITIVDIRGLLRILHTHY